MGANIIETFVSGFSGLGGGLATAAVEIFDTMFVSAEGGLTNLATWGLIFGGASLIIGLVAWAKKKAG